jgi:hypothetical protein
MGAGLAQGLSSPEKRISPEHFFVPDNIQDLYEFFTGWSRRTPEYLTAELNYSGSGHIITGQRYADYNMRPSPFGIREIITGPPPFLNGKGSCVQRKIGDSWN